MVYINDDGDFVEVVWVRIVELNVRIVVLKIDVDVFKIVVCINYFFLYF